MNNIYVQGVTHEQAIALYFIVYLAIFIMGLRSRDFRSTFAEWMSFKDPLGLKFWTKNWWFLMITLFYFLAGGFLTLSMGT